jgi:site-specific DNA recombinase
VPFRWGEIPALVDRQRWERVQRKITSRRQRAARPRAKGYVLSGLLYCGHCGSRMFGDGSKAPCPGRPDQPYVYRYYLCNGSANGGCNEYRIREDRLLPFLIRRLREEYLAPARLADLRGALVEQLRQRQQGDPARVRWLRERLALLERELKAGRGKLYAEDDPRIYAELRTAQQEKLDLKARYEKEAASLEGQPGLSPAEQEKQVDAALARLEDLHNRLNETDPARLRDVLPLLVSRIELWFTAPPDRKRGGRYHFRHGVVKLRPVLHFASNGDTSGCDRPGGCAGG